MKTQDAFDILYSLINQFGDEEDKAAIDTICTVSTKNHLTIYDCRECADWYPADTYGCGSACGCLPPEYPIVPEINGTTPIPDWCPRLKKLPNGNTFPEKASIIKNNPEQA